MIRIKVSVLILVVVVGAWRSAQAVEPAAAEGGFDLFDPVPLKNFRELSPDRPDKTESPYTVDAGHFQLEMDFANFAYHRMDGVTVTAWNITPFNLKVGLLDNADLQLVYDNYLNVRTVDHQTGLAQTQSGLGNLTVRLKINLWGNDGGQTAFGLLPFVAFPTSTAQLGNPGVAGGILLPLAVKLPCGFDLGLETGLVFSQNESGRSYHEEFVNSLTVGHNIAGNLGGYVEFFSSVSTERGTAWVGTVDAGFEYAVTKNLQLDCGCNFGITRAADAVNPFAGITLRF